MFLPQAGILLPSLVPKLAAPLPSDAKPLTAKGAILASPAIDRDWEKTF